MSLPIGHRSPYTWPILPRIKFGHKFLFNRGAWKDVCDSVFEQCLAKCVRNNVQSSMLTRVYVHGNVSVQKAKFLKIPFAASVHNRI